MELPYFGKAARPLKKSYVWPATEVENRSWYKLYKPYCKLQKPLTRVLAKPSATTLKLRHYLYLLWEENDKFVSFSLFYRTIRVQHASADSRQQELIKVFLFSLK
jgi:hypothetical protein